MSHWLEMHSLTSGRKYHPAGTALRRGRVKHIEMGKLR